MKYIVEESDQFVGDVEEAVVWILLSNVEQSESFAIAKVDEFSSEINSLKERLQKFPESGESTEIQDIRRFPIYNGRYSVKWIVNHVRKTVVLLALSDSKYPKHLRQFQFDE